MSKLRIILVILAFSLIFCESGNIFDTDKMNEQGALLNFLQDTKMQASGAAITVENCLDKSILKTTKLNVEPLEVVKGQPLRIKALGILLSDQVINKLHLDSYYNGAVIFTDNVDKGNTLVKKGPYGFNYEAAVPTFVPAGKWEIFITLLNEKEEKLSCTKVSWEMP